jgi:hypothetical protein
VQFPVATPVLYLLLPQFDPFQFLLQLLFWALGHLLLIVAVHSKDHTKFHRYDFFIDSFNAKAQPCIDTLENGCH